MLKVLFLLFLLGLLIYDFDKSGVVEDFISIIAFIKFIYLNDIRY